MNEERVLARIGIVVFFLEVICGITSAVSTSYGRSQWVVTLKTVSGIDYVDATGHINPKLSSSDARTSDAFQYTMVVAPITTMLAFIYLLVHVTYLVPPLSRTKAAIDLTIVSILTVFHLTGVIYLPAKVNFFSSGSGGPAEDWVLKLGIAWIFLLLGFLLWIAALVLYALILMRIGRQAATTDDVAHTDPSKHVQMHTLLTQDHPMATGTPTAA